MINMIKHNQIIKNDQKLKNIKKDQNEQKRSAMIKMIKNDQQ